MNTVVLPKLLLIFTNTAGKVVYFATILHAQNLKGAALLDSDSAGDQAAQQEALVHTFFSGFSDTSLSHYPYTRGRAKALISFICKHARLVTVLFSIILILALNHSCNECQTFAERFA